MKQVQNMQIEYLVKKMGLIMKELHKLITPQKSKKTMPSLYGILKGVNFSETEITQAKKSLFPYSYGKKKI